MKGSLLLSSKILISSRLSPFFALLEPAAKDVSGRPDKELESLLLPSKPDYLNLTGTETNSDFDLNQVLMATLGSPMIIDGEAVNTSDIVRN